MALLQFKHITFSYPEQAFPALNDVNFTIEPGSFTVICGPNGCGKSTLLKLCKTALIPSGVLDGEVIYNGTVLSQIPLETQCISIGYVSQNPQDQIVADTVEQELAFTLESLGWNQEMMHRRIGEIASYFGMHSWLHQKTSALSGGQQQILNIASAIIPGCKLLLLDEPSSQLDPATTRLVFDLLQQLNEELGLTIVITEQHLESLWHRASQFVIMDQGRFILTGSPSEVALALMSSDNPLRSSTPTALQLYESLKQVLPDTSNEMFALPPFTIAQGRQWLENNFGSEQNDIKVGKPSVVIDAPSDKHPSIISSQRKRNAIIRADHVWVRYKKDQADVLTDAQFELIQGETLALLGANGSGKTTLLHTLLGNVKPYRGKIQYRTAIEASWTKQLPNNMAYLPQNVQYVFTEQTIKQDWQTILNQTGNDLLFLGEHWENEDKLISYCAQRFSLQDCLQKHPHDLSGGELQRAALVKVLLTNPEILLMDEPTKALDIKSIHLLEEYLQLLQSHGTTLLIVSHDIDFCARIATRVGMIFDGAISNCQSPQEFFSTMEFFTTAASRMGRSVFPKAITLKDLVSACIESTNEDQHE